jgi:peptidoglycan/LPS O-acetylase OafA/YrhL
MVLAFHSSGRFAKLSHYDDQFARFPVVSGGWRGVDLFFVLSGYLIGRQLWRELRTTGSIRLGRFIVLRRGLRIWPLYYFALAVYLVGSRAGKELFWSGRWWTDAAFLSNYLPGNVIMGAWSLCIEEQFYLVTPILILIPVLISRRVTLEGYRPWLVGVAIALPVIRMLALHGSTIHFATPNAAHAYLYHTFHTHADALVIGLLLANLTDGRAPQRPGLAIGAVFASLVLTVVGRKLWPAVFDFTSSALVFGSITWLLLSVPRVSATLFGFRLFHVISRLSYGIYLNHQLLLEWFDQDAFRLVRSTGLPLGLGNVAYFVIFTILSAAVAVVSFCVIEWPFLRLRDRLLKPRSNEQGAG